MKNGQRVAVLMLKSGETICIPTEARFANARVLNTRRDGTFTVHWEGNYNRNGDFRTELMTFNDKHVMDEGDLEERNQVRIENGLVPIN